MNIWRRLWNWELWKVSGRPESFLYTQFLLFISFPVPIPFLYPLAVVNREQGNNLMLHYVGGSSLGGWSCGELRGRCVSKVHTWKVGSTLSFSCHVITSTVRLWVTSTPPLCKVQLSHKVFFILQHKSITLITYKKGEYATYLLLRSEGVIMNLVA